ncbi:hypothetical protein [Cognatishimia maritima]|uniref:Uncharacterized protein n=1 Tax=Cognatishimia maritima TaxID=870908 RepID=A0A1M5VTU3_9RHOB|nr:hypothetical protein [Cognatishimia maritima]SHH78699.1 hypothetical protein SAMN04488044_3262 [Cognatishimia maritima]
MSGSENILVVLLEEDDLRMVHRDWPRKMRLAVCLMPSGDCQLLLFRQEEAGIFAARLRKQLGLRAKEICVYPPVHGFPTRQLRYSDQRSLATLLADSPQLVEEADDYSVNFAFALEEGLEPSAFLGVDSEPMVTAAPVASAQAAREVEVATSDGALHFASRRAPVPPPAPAAEKPLRNLHLDLGREAARRDPPAPKLPKEKGAVVTSAQSVFPGAAFTSLADMKDETDAPAFSISEDGNHFVISGGAGAQLDIRNAGQLFLRDDRQLLAIQRAEAGDAAPGTVRIEADLLPASLRSVLRKAIGAVDVSHDAAFLYVTLPVDGAAPEEKTPVVAEALKKPSPQALKRRRRFRLFALTTLTTLAILVILGMQPVNGISQNAKIGPIDWSQFRLSMQAN